MKRVSTGLVLAAAVLAAPIGATAAEGRHGYHITPSGYRAPVFGSFADASRPVCRRLTPVEVESRDLDRLSRVRSQSAPSRATVSTSGQGLVFNVVYDDQPGTGFNDPVLGSTRRAAFAAALQAWSRVIVGTVPITVEARFLGADAGNTLAAAGPSDFISQDGRLVPSALAAQRAGVPVTRGGSDLTVSFGPRDDWDYVADGVAPRGTYSFVYTAIHEIGHGLGFIDSFDPDTGETLNGLPFSFDVFVNRGTAAGNLLLGRDGRQVRSDLVSSDLYFAGPNAVRASLASIRPLPMVRLYAPAPFEPGSSIAHLDQETYADLRTGLMVPADFGPDEAYVDTLALAILADLGYATVPAAIVPPR